MDRHLCTLSGYAAVEHGREAEMARRLREACAERQRVLAVIELPRVAGVVVRVVDVYEQIRVHGLIRVGEMIGSQQGAHGKEVSTFR